MGYGRQRVWGTIGFGIAAFLAGYAVDIWSRGETLKIYTPAFVLIFVFSFFDLLCCRKLDVSILKFRYKCIKIYALFILFLIECNPLKILLTATDYGRIRKCIERCFPAFKDETHTYISLLCNNCWHF